MIEKKVTAGEPSSAPPAAKIRQALMTHWLSQIECNHHEKNDSAICACGWKSERAFNVGKAVEFWIDHVFERSGAAQEVSPPISDMEFRMCTCNQADGVKTCPLHGVEEVSPPSPDARILKAYEDAADHARNRPHKTVAIQVWADIDEAIAPLVAYLNTIPGVRTNASCQGTKSGPHPYEAYVLATWNREADERLKAEFNVEYLGELWGYIRAKTVDCRCSCNPMCGCDCHKQKFSRGGDTR